MKGLIWVRVQCTYNQEYEIFLKAVVDYVIERWGDELDLSGAETIELQALNEYGKEIIVVGEGEMAKCFCHELEHLDGEIFLDKAVEEIMLW